MNGMMDGSMMGAMCFMMVLGLLIFFVILGATVYTVVRLLMKKNEINYSPAFVGYLTELRNNL